MFDPPRIEEISITSKREKWPYPKTFDALKAAGVLSYDVQVSTHAITHHGENGVTYREPSPMGFIPLTIGPVFSADGVKAAIARNQKKETTYRQFLEAIAQAGCTHYRVSMIARTVSYCGADGREHVEKVPSVS